MSIKFSLLVCTLNREKELFKCVKSLINQTYSSFEIIIIDQSDEINNTFIILDKVKYKHINKRGLSNARNEGLSLCEGNWIALIDDDATYESDYLKNAAEFIDSCNGQVGIVSGIGYDVENQRYLISSMRTKEIKKVSWNSIFKYCISAGMIIRSDIALKNKFDINFGVGSGTIYGAGEESDLVIEALKIKENVYFNPQMVFYHKSDIEIPFEKVYSYSCGHGGLLKKHYLKTNKPLFLYLFCISILRSLAGCTLYILGKNRYEKSIYTLKGKINGFILYNEKLV